MNPAAAQNLDPKLKETYDRIMGTQAAPAQPPSQKPSDAPTQPQEHVPIEQVVVPQVSPVEQVPSPVTSAEPEMVNINATAEVAKPAAVKGKISPVIFIVLGVGFFLFYTVVWLKIFNIF